MLKHLELLAIDLHQAVEHLRSTLAIVTEQPIESLTITPISLFLSFQPCVLHPVLFFFFSCHFQLCTSWHTVQAGGTQTEEARSFQMYSFTAHPFKHALKQFWLYPRTTMQWDCWSGLSGHHVLLESLASQDLFLVDVKSVKNWMATETCCQKLPVPKLDYGPNSSTGFASLSFFCNSVLIFQCFSSSSRDPSGV